MIIADFDPVALHKVEYQIRMKQARLNENMARQYDLLEEEKKMRAELAVLEENKYRLLTGRNI